MLLIGENLNVISKKTANALKQKDASTIKEMALAQADAGMDMIDINLGPARKDGPELMEWVVKTVQDVVDLPLSLDTTNIDAIEAGLNNALYLKNELPACLSISLPPNLFSQY